MGFGYDLLVAAFNPEFAEVLPIRRVCGVERGKNLRYPRQYVRERGAKTYIIQVFDQPRQTSVRCAVAGPSPTEEAHLSIGELRWEWIEEAEQLRRGRRMGWERSPA